MSIVKKVMKDMTMKARRVHFMGNGKEEEEVEGLSKRELWLKEVKEDEGYHAQSDLHPAMLLT